jgi:hypothetical protein
MGIVVFGVCAIHLFAMTSTVSACADGGAWLERAVVNRTIDGLPNPYPSTRFYLEGVHLGYSNGRITINGQPAIDGNTTWDLSVCGDQQIRYQLRYYPNNSGGISVVRGNFSGKYRRETDMTVHDYEGNVRIDFRTQPGQSDTGQEVDSWINYRGNSAPAGSQSSGSGSNSGPGIISVPGVIAPVAPGPRSSIPNPGVPGVPSVSGGQPSATPAPAFCSGTEFNPARAHLLVSGVSQTLSKFTTDGLSLKLNTLAPGDPVMEVNYQYVALGAFQEWDDTCNGRPVHYFVAFQYDPSNVSSHTDYELLVRVNGKQDRYGKDFSYQLAAKYNQSGYKSAVVNYWGNR